METPFVLWKRDERGGGMRALRKMLVFATLLACLAGIAVAEGSWGQINQPITQEESLPEFDPDSPFKLGAKTPIEGGLFEMDYGTYPCLDGSTVSVPMGLAFARRHLGLSGADAEGFVFFSTTHAAYEHLILKEPNGTSQIVSESAMMRAEHPVDLFLGTPPSEDELALAEAYGVELVVTPICLDAFVFIVNVDNPVESLTIAQIQGIFAGEITNWAQVGGSDLPIEAFQREKNSGSQTAMESLVMGGKPLDALGRTEVISGMGGLVERIASYRNSARSIGYTFKYYVDTLYRSDRIKVLAVEGVPPSPEHLRDASYPFTAPYCGVIRAEDEAGVGGRFLEWILSEQGQQCLAQAGYVPIKELP